MIATVTATIAGTYYARISGQRFQDYTLLVTRDSAFDIGNNDSSAVRNVGLHTEINARSSAWSKCRSVSQRNAVRSDSRATSPETTSSLRSANCSNYHKSGPMSSSRR